MLIRLQKNGDDYEITIPETIMQQLQLSIGDELEIVIDESQRSFHLVPTKK